ncbi:MAG: GNAT family N-acetyltransferase [Gemmatimonadota bacterium]|nr:GNAT family N-acetyltransferase [Gemmatimonadota bacterium]
MRGAELVGVVMGAFEPVPAAMGSDFGTDVTLRRAHPADAARILAWRQEPSARRHQPLQPRELASIEAEIATQAVPTLGPNLDDKLRWIVEANREPVGWITLTVTNREHATATVGYTIAERYQRRGHASAALRAVVALAFAADGANLERLEAVAAVANQGSRAVLVKAGFREEGIARGLLVIDGVRIDHARYALLRSEWHNPRHRG